MKAAKSGIGKISSISGHRIGSDWVLETATGKITFLRINAVGSGFGPPDDFIDVECIIKLASRPTKAFGFRIRDIDSPDRAMFELIRDTFFHGRVLFAEYLIQPGRNNGILYRAVVQS